MQQKIIGYHVDEDGDWVAELACQHNQHVRHNPPWMNRVWVVTEEGRSAHIGKILNCVKCDRSEPVDRIGASVS